MIRRLNYVMAIAAVAIIGFTSCSDDSNTTKQPAKDIAKTYTGTELQLSNEGQVITGGTIKITAIDDTKAKLVLEGIVNGQASFEIEAKVNQTKAEYAFQGTKTIDGMKVDVTGNITDGKATTDVKIEILSKDIIGLWGFTTDYANPTLIFDIQTKSDSLTYLGNIEPETIAAAEFSNGIASMGGSVLGSALEDFSFNFQSNGYVGVKGKSLLSPEGSQNIDILKLGRYYYNPTTKELLFDAPLDELLGSMGMSGTMYVPFKCTLVDGTLSAVINPEFIAQFIPMIPEKAKLEAMLSILDGLIPANIAPLLPWIKGNILTVTTTLTDKNNFKSISIGCNLVPVK